MIYKTSSDNNARYSLGTKCKNPFIVFGVNPSTATDKKFDRTITKVVGFSKKLGFDGWLMLNIYPQRATNPDDLHKKFKPEYCKENIEAVKTLLAHYKKPLICAAWGKTIENREYLMDCLLEINKEIEKLAPQWKMLGIPTKNGHPRHPSRISYNVDLKDFDINSYLR